MHVNAFANSWLGSNTYGLLGALPQDMMHAFLQGVLMYVLDVITSPLLLEEKSRLDEFVVEIIVSIRSSAKAQFSRCIIIRGITNLTLLTGDESAGAAFVLAFGCCIKPGSDMLKTLLQDLKMLLSMVKNQMLKLMMIIQILDRMRIGIKIHFCR